MLKIALCQSKSIRGAVDQNIQSHLEWIEKAAKENADLIVFPELSITGYEPDLASELAFKVNDERLNQLKAITQSKDIIAIVGAPLKKGQELYIASFILYPNGTTEYYTKHFLHEGEEVYFTPGTSNPLIEIKGERIYNAICADTTHPEHAEMAAHSNATIYLASVFVTPNGYEKDAAQMQSYAKRYNMITMMANYGGPSGKFQTAGKSTAWGKDGELLGRLETEKEGILFIDY